MEFLIISGLSGAGKSRASDILEDLDYYCVDNMPVALIPKFAELCAATKGRYEKVALVTDVRELPRVMREAFYIAREGRPGPVLVDICKDVQNATIEFEYPEKIFLPSMTRTRRPAPQAKPSRPCTATPCTCCSRTSTPGGACAPSPPSRLPRPGLHPAGVARKVLEDRRPPPAGCLPGGRQGA